MAACLDAVIGCSAMQTTRFSCKTQDRSRSFGRSDQAVNRRAALSPLDPIRRTSNLFCREPQRATIASAGVSISRYHHLRAHHKTPPASASVPVLTNCHCCFRISFGELGPKKSFHPTIVSVIRSTAGCACCGSRDVFRQIVRDVVFPPA